MKRRKVRAVLRYHVQNPERNPEQYGHHVLFSFYLLRDEGNLKHPPISENYLAKLQQPEILNVVNQSRHDTFLEQENDETEFEIREAVDSLPQNEDPAEKTVLLEDMSQIQSTRPVLIQDEELNSKIRTLNDKQRKFFEIIHGWAKKSVKNLSSLAPTAIEPLHIFSHEMLLVGRAF